MSFQSSMAHTSSRIQQESPRPNILPNESQASEVASTTKQPQFVSKYTKMLYEQQ